MSRFSVRYKLGQHPPGADEHGVVVVEAAMFVTEGKFIDFYGGSVHNMAGRLNPTGAVVFRVSEDVVADIAQQPA